MTAQANINDSSRRRFRRRPNMTNIRNNSAWLLAPVQRSFLATLDKWLLGIVILLLISGSIMVYSATFDWSNETYGTATGFFVNRHLRNIVGSGILLIFFAGVDYRFWKQFALFLLLGTIGALIAVLLFGDDKFGARRSLIGGSLQPGELAEFTIVVYMAQWLASKNTRVGSFFFGFLPFITVVGAIAILITQQPDLSSAAIVAITAGIMYFVAGANILHISTMAGLLGALAYVLVAGLGYAQTRIADFLNGINELTSANYHTQQAIAALMKGGWTGVGLGQSTQKFGALPAPHTDSIFAVIGEEFGVLGATFVIVLYIAFAVRGFRLAWRADDPFGSLLCVGFTSWVIIQALLNIAVMTNAVPPTGVPLPFISYGGSSLFPVMSGIGLMLSVQRVALGRRQRAPEWSNEIAYSDRIRGNWRSRLSRPGDSPSAINHQQ